jgi:hypothetical protein
MNHIDFVLWMVLWPSACWFSRCWEIKTDMMQKITSKPVSQSLGSIAITILFEMIVWIWVGRLVWRG